MRFLRHAIVLIGLALVAAVPAAAQAVPSQAATNLQNQLVVRKDGSVYLVRDGARHKVTPATFGDDDFAALPEGDPYTSGLVPIDAIMAVVGGASAAPAAQQDPAAPAGGSAPSIFTTAPSASASSTPTQTALPSSVHVSLSEWSITPDSTTLTAGKVTFDVSDTGKGQHEMVLFKSDKDPASLPVSKGTVDEGAVGDKIGELEDFKAGDHKTATFDLKPGSYILICNLVNHYNKGMVQHIEVQ